jgi:hypothetical protein
MYAEADRQWTAYISSQKAKEIVMVDQDDKARRAKFVKMLALYFDGNLPDANTDTNYAAALSAADAFFADATAKEWASVQKCDEGREYTRKRDMEFGLFEEDNSLNYSGWWPVEQENLLLTVDTMARKIYSESSYGKAVKAKTDAEAQARWNAMSPEEQAQLTALKAKWAEEEARQRQEQIQREESDRQHEDMEELIDAIRDAGGY